MANKTCSILITILVVPALMPIAAAASNCPAQRLQSLDIVATRSVGEAEGPSIHIDAGNALSVRLEANAGARIDIDSVRVRYRGFDVTEKVRDAVGEFAPAIEVPGDLLPSGRHRIAIIVRDDAGRRAVLKVTLRVTERDTTTACDDAVVAQADKIDTRPQS